MERVRLLVVVVVIGALSAPWTVTAQQTPVVEREAVPKALRPTPAPPAPVAPDARLIAGTKSSAFTTIQGNALTSTNGMLTDATVRLRDARSGRIIDVATTDKAGLFVFRQVSPGTYVAELLGPDGRVVAASQLLVGDAGQTILAIVKMPFRIPFAGVLGNTAPAAAIITATAAASGVLATRVAGSDVSPRQ